MKIFNSRIKQIDNLKFHSELQKLQSIIGVEVEEQSITDLLEQLNKVSECANKLVNDPIELEIDKLKSILKEKGANSEFCIQLDSLSEFVRQDVAIEKYEPINDIFIDVYSNQAKEKGISLLCSELDNRTGGLHSGKICTIVGGPGSMKTTYATNICYEAIKQGKNICFLSLEETELDIYSKLLSRVSVDLHEKLSVQKITQHKLDEDEFKMLKEEVYPYLENLKGTFYLLGESDLGDFSQLTIESKLKLIDEKIKIKSREKQDDENHGIDILVVDHLQMCKYVNSKIKDPYQLINMYVAFFRRQCKKFLNQDREIIVILLSQCNREGIAYAAKHDGQYLMQHVAEASEIERASSYIISTYTDAGIQISKQLKIGAVKLRGSALPITTINVFSDGEFYQVGDIIETEKINYSMDSIMNDNINKKTSSELNLDDILGGML